MTHDPGFYILGFVLAYGLGMAGYCWWKAGSA
jgi:hypothetical protein